MPCTGRTSMLGMLRAACRKFALTSAPSMISALLRPSFSKRSRRPLVLPASIAAWSSTMMPPSLALAESAWRKASARTFFGRSMAWLRTTGPNERPPPRNRLTRAEPCRALPVPFWRYIFLPVRQISARFLTLWVPRWRLASCQLTQRWIRSARGSRPKIASDSSTEPAALPSRVVTCSSMSRSLSGRRLRRRLALGRRSGPAFVARQAEFSRLRHAVGQPLLHGVAHRDPTTLSARHRALDQDEAARDVGLHHLEIERGHALDTQVAGHLLALEGLARVLAAPGERCEIDTPCEARKPPKFQRFIGPAKPLPIDVPVTSTYWPTTKWSAVISAPTGISASSLTRNSATLRLGSTLDTAKCPR